jgi:hypothetical protein
LNQKLWLSILVLTFNLFFGVKTALTQNDNTIIVITPNSEPITLPVITQPVIVITPESLIVIKSQNNQVLTINPQGIPSFEVISINFSNPNIADRFKPVLADDRFFPDYSNFYSALPHWYDQPTAKPINGGSLNRLSTLPPNPITQPFWGIPGFNPNVPTASSILREIYQQKGWTN